MKVGIKKAIAGTVIDNKNGLITFYHHENEFVVSQNYVIKTFTNYAKARKYLKTLGV